MVRARKSKRPATPSRQSKARALPGAVTRRVGPSATQRDELPRRRGKRNARPKRLHISRQPGRHAAVEDNSEE